MPTPSNDIIFSLFFVFYLLLPSNDIIIFYLFLFIYYYAILLCQHHPTTLFLFYLFIFIIILCNTIQRHLFFIQRHSFFYYYYTVSIFIIPFLFLFFYYYTVSAWPSEVWGKYVFREFCFWQLRATECRFREFLYYTFFSDLVFACKLATEFWLRRLRMRSCRVTRLCPHRGMRHISRSWNLALFSGSCA